MLRSVHDLQDYAIRATDGDIGQVKDFYVYDERWAIRYLVVDAGTWLSGRKVLISPISLGHPNWSDKVLPVSITREQVKNSPDIDTEKPVSRQHEMNYLDYYGYPYYWTGAGMWGPGAYPSMMMSSYGGIAVTAETEKADAIAEAARHEDDDPHLRSGNARVAVSLTRQQVKDSPAYDSAAQLNRGQEASIHKHYQRRGYWTNETKPDAVSRL